MHVEKTDRQIGELIAQISAGEIRLPELQRDFVWKPTQVAKLVDSLYRGYPSGSLLFWEADAEPTMRKMAVDTAQQNPMRAPLYLLDGQQRLTSLHRVFNDHPDAQIVFHVGTERFQNQSASTRADPRWVKVSELLNPQTSIFQLMHRLTKTDLGLSERDIEQRVTRVRLLGERTYHLEILKGFPYDQIAEIFVRVNSAGRRLNTLDLATATLSSRWPGMLARLEAEADRWRAADFGDIDVNFLSRAFTGAVLGRGLSAWSHGRLATASDSQLETGWATVRGGLSRLIPLLRDTLGVTRSDVLPSMIALIPLVVLLGERPDDRLDEQTANGILYWLLVATATARYSGSTDTLLGQDIQSARDQDAVKAMLGRLSINQGRPRMTVETLRGRTKDSPQAFLALLAVRRRGARDWWHGTELLSQSTGHGLRFHQIHPTVSLGAQHRTLAHELANYVFVSERTAQQIGARPLREFVPELDNRELVAHCVPVEDDLLDPVNYESFLDARCAQLANAINDLLDHFQPAWVARIPGVDDTAQPALNFVCYGTAWDSGTLVFTATGPDIQWTGDTDLPTLAARIDAAARTGFDSDVEIGAENAPVTVTGDSVSVVIGPFVVSGSPDQWRQAFDQKRRDARAPAQRPSTVSPPWPADRTPFSLEQCR